MEPHRGWTSASRSWNFLRKRWLDREQKLITVIQEETKRTEENEEAGYRSPTWSILRALQKIHEAKRLEGTSVMSAPPFFQSARRGDLKFWGEDDRPTVVVWESLSESEQEQWSEKWASRRIKCSVSLDLKPNLCRFLHALLVPAEAEGHPSQ